jgi:hypothetical protein
MTLPVFCTTTLFATTQSIGGSVVMFVPEVPERPIRIGLAQLTKVLKASVARRT